MYGKRLITLLLALIGAFIVFMIISFFLYPVFNPYDDDMPGDFDLGEFYEYNYLDFGPAAIVRLRKEIIALEEEVERFRTKETQDLAIIDSLFAANMRLEEDILRIAGPGGIGGPGMGVNGQLAAQRTPETKAQEVSRSLLRLDEDEVRRILVRLSERELIEIYRASSPMQREAMLRALDPGKAAVVIRDALS